MSTEIEDASLGPICESLGVTIDFTFVPYSVAKERRKQFKFPEDKDEWKCVTWEVTIRKNGSLVLTELYSSGIACLPDYYQRKNVGARELIDDAIETGKVIASKSLYESALSSFQISGRFPVYNVAKKAIRLPKPDDVLAAFVKDAECAYHATTFEEFCGDFGYSTDSKTAERIYHACQQTLIRLSRHFVMDDLNKLFEDW